MVKRKPPTNLAASVRQRLGNVAHERGQELQLVLTRYGVERLLYRLGHVPEGRRFVLKGAVLFYLWEGDVPRPTQDVDFLGSGDASPGAVAQLFRDVCGAAVEPDGLAFLTESVDAVPIRGRNEYGGVRVRLIALLGKARIPLQIDVAFGDAVTPRARLATFPTLLDFPAPRVRAYPPETVVAEKLHAMVTLGMANTRMKDFYDLFVIATTQRLDREMVVAAIGATFARRGTAIPIEAPIALTETFGRDREKQAQWRAFLNRAHLRTVPTDLSAVIERIAAFVLPSARGSR